MKTIGIIFLFISISGFAQENIINPITFYSSISSTGDYEQETVPQKISSTLLFTGLAAATMGINIWMREGVFQDNHSDNWWGTVNGTFTLGLAGTITGFGITSLIYKISGERFNERFILLGSVAGLIGGAGLAFFPPFFQEFRENQYLYYLYPGLMTAGFIGIIFDTWFGGGNRREVDLTISPKINNYGQGISIIFSKHY